MILEIDHTQIDGLAKDVRLGKIRAKSGEIRPWLTLALERRSRHRPGIVYTDHFW